jgi:hypothetical protein
VKTYRRETKRRKLDKKQRAERQALAEKQLAERAKLREKQKANREKELAQDPTKAGGKRPGAGRPQSVRHVPCIEQGQDMNPRKTLTFYGAEREKPIVRRFVKVWRALEYDTPQASTALSKMGGILVYKFLTGEELTPRDIKKICSLLPADVLKKLGYEVENKLEEVDFKS